MSKRFLSTKGKILIDAALCLGSYVAALVIGIGAIPDATAARPLLLAAPAIACARILSFQVFSVYRAAWKHVSVTDALAIVEGALPVTLLWLAGRLLVPAAWPLFAVPSSVIALEFLLVLVATFGVRAADRLRHESPDTARADNVLVIGAGDGAERFISDWRRKVRPGIRIVALVDDHPAAPRAILGVPLLGDTSRIPELLGKLRIDEAVITIPDMTPEDERRIMRLFTGSRARVSRLPGRIEQIYDDAGPAPVPPPDVEAMAREQLALFRTLTGREYDCVSEATYPVAHQYEVNKPFSDPEGSSGDLLMAAGTMIKLLRLPAGAEVLDLGCGCGWTSIVLARCGFRVTAVDLNAASLATGRANARTLGVEVDFVAGDMQDFHADRVFDAVVIFDALHHCPRERLVLSRAHAALRAGGKIVLCEQGYPDEDGVGVLTHPSVVGVMREHGTLEKGLGRRYLVRALFDSGFERATVLTAQGQYRTWVVARKPCPGVAAARSVHYASDFANALWQYE